MTIKFYKTADPFGFMNNFVTSPFFLYERNWANVESAYQAQKCVGTDPDNYEAIWRSKTPREAKNIGMQCKIRSDWEEVKYNIMKECVFAKFSQNEDFKEKLLATDDQYIIEDSPIDAIWGRGPNHDGKNWLGKILMEVRELIRS